jgi:hypothetical protein
VDGNVTADTLRVCVRCLLCVRCERKHQIALYRVSSTVLIEVDCRSK